MDSRNPLNPYGQSPSLVGLLNSQNFPYESYQSGVHFGESQQADIPPFSSQETATPLASKDRKKWTPADDESVADYETIMEMKREDWEMKKDDLDRKERLSKLAILDTLLAKKEPLKEAEEVVKTYRRSR
uniref:No apical meristem-associated C-terminal domain-containing protein n=1 Tax=Brassica campestris TaxID=3711 RepID=A0A3P5YVS8_BRACM|nr:unnamed protein product [Brassica rapa]